FANPTIETPLQGHIGGNAATRFTTSLRRASRSAASLSARAWRGRRSGRLPARALAEDFRGSYRPDIIPQKLSVSCGHEFDDRSPPRRNASGAARSFMVGPD